MIRYRGFQLPPELHEARKRAVKLSWLSILFLLSVAVPLAPFASSAAVVKAALLEALISLVPPIVILVTFRLYDRQPTTWYPQGHVRAVAIGYLIGAVALTAVGFYIVADSLRVLVMAERTALGTLEFMGELYWIGWVVIAVLAWSIVPPIVLGHFKLKIAKQLHDRQFYADAKLNKADWLTASVSIVGIVGIGFGVWWLDALAAGIIGIDVLHDGVVNTRSAVADLLGRTPRTIDGKHIDPLVAETQACLRRLPWVERAEVRMREEGMVLTGEAHVVPRSGTPDLVARVREARQAVCGLHWRLATFEVVPVDHIDDEDWAPDPHREAYPKRTRERLRHAHGT